MFRQTFSLFSPAARKSLRIYAGDEATSRRVRRGCRTQIFLQRSELSFIVRGAMYAENLYTHQRSH